VDWYLQAHVLCALDRQSVPGVVVNHLRNGEEPPRKIGKLEVAVESVTADPHVHVPAGTPKSEHNMHYTQVCIYLQLIHF